MVYRESRDLEERKRGEKGMQRSQAGKDRT
jgi:hypothetical protein